jgi:hypothetical protein
MEGIHVRGAALDDTASISALWRSHITIWQRVNPQGQVEDVPYEALTLYERWLHGGPWMSVETGAIHLSHLLLGAGIPLVAQFGGQIIAYAEAYHGVEPVPFGDHLHLANLVVLNGRQDEGLDDAIVTHLRELARSLNCQRLTATCVGSEPAAEALFRRHEMLPLVRLERLTLPAKSGQGFYKAVEHLNPDPGQIADWFMPIGRQGSARQQWETLWPLTWNALPEIVARRSQRIHLSAAGQEAFLCCQQGLYAPRNADIYLWSPKPLTSQLLTSIRDWSHREGYRSLIMLVTDDTAKTLGPEAEPDGYYQDVFAVDV